MPWAAGVYRAIGFYGVGLNIIHLLKDAYEKENIFQKSSPKKVNSL
jgi:hypothetical protein